MTRMFKKKTGEVVEVYKVFLSDSGCVVALVYNPETDTWEQLRINKLRPCDANEREAKKRLTLREAVWRTTDNRFYTNDDYEMALEHEMELMKDEALGG